MPEQVETYVARYENQTSGVFLSTLSLFIHGVDKRHRTPDSRT